MWVVDPPLLAYNSRVVAHTAYVQSAGVFLRRRKIEIGERAHKRVAKPGIAGTIGVEDHPIHVKADERPHALLTVRSIRNPCASRPERNGCVGTHVSCGSAPRDVISPHAIINAICAMGKPVVRIIAERSVDAS